jgi:hypothetical protein
MSISDLDLNLGDAADFKPCAGPADGARVTLHRIASVRRQQGISLRRLARNSKISFRDLEHEEDESSDLLLSRVYWWQHVLEVPVADLLVDSDAPLSEPVLRRARMVKIMKTAAAILERTTDNGARRLAQTLVDQLVEIMPELEGVSPWHAVGQRRTLDEMGRIVERTFSSEIFRDGRTH